jgi:hypothetical protein
MDAFAPTQRLAHRPVVQPTSVHGKLDRFERGPLSPMHLGRPEGLQLGRKDVAESVIRTEIQTGIHQHARSQNVPMLTMQWFVVVCAPPAPCVASDNRGVIGHQGLCPIPQLTLVSVSRAVRRFTAGVVGRVRGIVNAASIERVAAVAANRIRTQCRIPGRLVAVANTAVRLRRAYTPCEGLAGYPPC